MAGATVIVAFAPPAPAQRAPAGWMIPPVDGPIAAQYLDPLGPYAAGHRGIDYAASAGTLVRAADTGRVTFAGPVANVRAVSIDHGDGVTSTYSSLAVTLVGAAEQVEQGQWIGRVGVAHEGGASGMHFGVKVDGNYVDPFNYLGPVGLAGAIHLAPVATDPPPIPTDDLATTLDALRSRAACRPAPPLADPPPPNRNIAVAIAGIGSATRAPSRLPDIYARGPALLGYPRASTYRFSYEGASVPSLHEPYDGAATYRDLREGAGRLRALLVRIARRAPGRPVDLIAHSQGGVIARLYLEHLNRTWDPRLPVIDHLVTFATPHEGAPLAEAAGRLEETLTGGPLLEWLSRRARSGSPWPDPLSDAVAQLVPGSSLLQGLAREDLSFGTRTLALGIANDVVVPADRAVLEGRLSRVVGPSGFNGHTAILSAGSALATAHAFLRDARRPCPTAWDSWGPRIGAGIGWIESRLPDLYGRLETALLRRGLYKLGTRGKS